MYFIYVAILVLGKAPEHQNAAKILGKRSLPASISADGKTAGKATNAVTVENLKQITHEGAVLADLTGEEATEKVRITLSKMPVGVEAERCSMNAVGSLRWLIDVFISYVSYFLHLLFFWDCFYFDLVVPFAI